MPSAVRKESYGSVTVFWLERDEAVRCLTGAARRLLAERPEVREVYLFGSLAEGRAVPGSDADVLVLLSESDERWLDRPLEYGPFFDDCGIGVELFCYTEEEADGHRLAERAQSRGVRLAGR